METSGVHGLITLLLATALGAQQRQPLVGNVVDANGKPVAAAAVILVEDDADLAGLDPVDRIECKTDERGRFVASVLRGVRYTGLAVGPETDGVAFVAAPVPNLTSSELADLRLVIAGHRRRVELRELKEWGDAAALRFELRFDGCPGHAIELPIVGGTHFEIPPLGASANVVLLDRDGGELGNLGHPLDPAQPVRVLPPVILAVYVVDERGEPVEGARVGIVSSSVRASSAARTDRNGRATLRYAHWNDPFEQPPDTLVVVAAKAGFAEAASGWICKQPFVDWRVVARHQRHEIRLPLHAEAPKRGSAIGKGLAGRTARVFAVGLVVHEQDGAVMNYFVPRHYDVAIATDGSFAVPELPRNVQDLRLQLPPIDGRRIVTLPSRDGTLPSVDLADCETLALQVLDPQGGPAGAAVVLLAPLQGIDLAHAPPIALDRSGRAEVLLQRGRWLVLAMDASSWAMQELESWSAATPVVLALAAKPSMRVRIVDGQGKPVVGARFEVGEFRLSPALPGPGALLQALGWNTFAEHVRREQTDERGEATIRFLPWPGVEPKAYAWRGDWTQRSDDFRVVPGEDAVTVPLRR